MKRVEFRKLKMFDKLVLIKQAVMDGKEVGHICSMLDDCIHKTGDYMSGTSQKKAIFTKEELNIMRKEKRAKIPKEPVRKIRWTKDNINTEARKRYEKAINEAHL